MKPPPSKFPYVLIALALVALAVVIGMFKLPPILTDTEGGRDKTGAKSLWSYRHLVLGVVGIFVYVGAEVSIGSFLVNYFSQSYIGGMNREGSRGVRLVPIGARP